MTLNDIYRELNVSTSTCSLQVVREKNSAPPHSSRIGHFVESINQELSSFRSSYVVFVPREANVVAHNLAKENISHRLNAVR